MPVLDACVKDETKHVCTMMESIDGQPLDKNWDTYNDTNKEKIIAHLKRYMDSLG